MVLIENATILLLSPSFLSVGSAAGQKREGFPRRVCSCYGEGKGGKVKSQVAYDTVLEIGGRLDDGVL
jgi:hypothetical protein